MDPIDYEKLSHKDLKALAKTNGIRNAHNRSKESLITALKRKAHREAGAGPVPSVDISTTPQAVPQLDQALESPPVGSPGGEAPAAGPSRKRSGEPLDGPATKRTRLQLALVDPITTVTEQHAPTQPVPVHGSSQVGAPAEEVPPTVPSKKRSGDPLDRPTNKRVRVKPPKEDSPSQVATRLNELKVKVRLPPTLGASSSRIRTATSVTATDAAPLGAAPAPGEKLQQHTEDAATSDAAPLLPAPALGEEPGQHTATIDAAPLLAAPAPGGEPQQRTEVSGSDSELVGNTASLLRGSNTASNDRVSMGIVHDEDAVISDPSSSSVPAGQPVWDGLPLAETDLSPEPPLRLISEVEALPTSFFTPALPEVPEAPPPAPIPLTKRNVLGLIVHTELPPVDGPHAGPSSDARARSPSPATSSMPTPAADDFINVYAQIEILRNHFLAAKGFNVEEQPDSTSHDKDGEVAALKRRLKKAEDSNAAILAFLEELLPLLENEHRAINDVCTEARNRIDQRVMSFKNYVDTLVKDWDITWASKAAALEQTFRTGLERAEKKFKGGFNRGVVFMSNLRDFFAAVIPKGDLYLKKWGLAKEDFSLEPIREILVFQSAPPSSAPVPSPASEPEVQGIQHIEEEKEALPMPPLFPDWLPPDNESVDESGPFTEPVLQRPVRTGDLPIPVPLNEVSHVEWEASRLPRENRVRVQERADGAHPDETNVERKKAFSSRARARHFSAMSLFGSYVEHDDDTADPVEELMDVALEEIPVDHPRSGTPPLSEPLDDEPSVPVDEPEDDAEVEFLVNRHRSVTPYPSDPADDDEVEDRDNAEADIPVDHPRPPIPYESPEL